MDQQYRMRRTAFTFSVLFLVVINFASIGTVLFWFFDDASPVIVHEARAVNPFVAPGDLLVIEWTATFNRDCPGVSRRRLRDGFFIDMPDYDLRGRPPGAKLGEPYTWRNSVTLPNIMPAGAWSFESKPQFSCNPIQRVFPIEPVVPLVEFIVMSDRPLD